MTDCFYTWKMRERREIEESNESEKQTTRDRFFPTSTAFPARTGAELCDICAVQATGKKITNRKGEFSTFKEQQPAKISVLDAVGPQNSVLFHWKNWNPQLLRQTGGPPPIFLGKRRDLPSNLNLPFRSRTKEARFVHCPN